MQNNLFVDTDKKKKALEIMKRLYKENPHPKLELDFKSPWELLVATMMAAQFTDRAVNTITPDFFKKFPDVNAVAKASAEEVDAAMSKVFRHGQKSKNIKAAAEIIVEKHNGKVPDNMEDLDALPGVARKTANQVLNNAYHKAYGIVIDTHGVRLSNKLGLSSSDDPVKIEQDLMELIPQDKWIDFGNLITLHGRHKCTARPHDCSDCVLGDLCPEYKKV